MKMVGFYLLCLCLLQYIVPSIQFLPWRRHCLISSYLNARNSPTVGTHFVTDTNKVIKRPKVMRYVYNGTYNKEGNFEGPNCSLLHNYRDGTPQWIYEGDFVDGYQEGNGTKKWYKENHVYVGEWFNGKREGVGVQRTDRGTYCGDWVSGRPDGTGKYRFQHGPTRGGQWWRGWQHGQGWYKYQNGDYYEGNFFKDFRKGHGTMKWANGDTYTGNWSMDKPFGYGKYTYADGAFGEGYFAFGKLDGLGNFTWANGDKHVGNWDHGIRYGEGYTTYIDGSPEDRGYWIRGRLVERRNLTVEEEEPFIHEGFDVIEGLPGAEAILAAGPEPKEPWKKVVTSPKPYAFRRLFE